MLRSGPVNERNQPRKFYIPPLFNVVPNQLNLTVVPNFCYYHLLVRLVLVQLLCTWKHLFAANTNYIMVIQHDPRSIGGKSEIVRNYPKTIDL